MPKEVKLKGKLLGHLKDNLMHITQRMPEEMRKKYTQGELQLVQRLGESFASRDSFEPSPFALEECDITRPDGFAYHLRHYMRLVTSGNKVESVPAERTQHLLGILERAATDIIAVVWPGQYVEVAKRAWEEGTNPFVPEKPFPKSTPVSNRAVVERLRNLERYLPAEYSHSSGRKKKGYLCPFADFLAGRIEHSHPDPLYFYHMIDAIDLALGDLENGTDGFNGKPIEHPARNMLARLPRPLYNLIIRNGMLDVIDAACPDYAPDFAEYAKQFWMDPNSV